MTLDPVTEQRAKSLLLSLADGDATDADRDELNGMLRDHADLRQALVRFQCDGSYIADVIKSSDEVAEVRQRLTLLAAAASSPQQRPALADSPRTSQVDAASRDKSLVGQSRHWLLSGVAMVQGHGVYVAVAASFLLMLFGWQYVSMRAELDRLHAIAERPDPAAAPGRQDAAGTGQASSSAARVTGLVSCEWPEGVNPLAFGDVLMLGDRLRLEKGLLQITFDMGAKVVIEGPSDFVVGSSNSATLDEGKIAAVVPQSGRGYTIFTPTAEVVDLGTEFGVAVNDQGASEVHVFDGDVVARSRGIGQSRPELIHARRDEAIQFDAAADQGKRILADQRKFVRRLMPSPSSDSIPPLPVSKDLSLWLAADMIQGLKEGSAVKTWPDILIGGNRFPDDAWQFDERRCPKWIRDTQGLPAVQFDGWTTYMATSPMSTGNEVTAFVVFAPGSVSFASELHGGMLLKFGPLTPSLEYSLMPDQRLKARIWAKDDTGNPAYSSELLSQSIQPLQISATAWTYDVEKNRSELFLNGVSQGVTDASRPLKQLARRYLGAHAEPWWEAYFLGSIYEVIVYDAVLAEPDRELVFEYLAERYGTPRGD